MSNLTNSDTFSNQSDQDNMENIFPPTNCLFCPQMFEDPMLIIDHCKTQHGFDLPAYVTHQKMDFYQYIKFINFIRTNKPLPEHVKNIVKSDWENETLPVNNEDSLLMIDIEDICIPLNNSKKLKSDGNNNNSSECENSKLKNRIHELESTIKNLHGNMHNLQEKLNHLLDEKYGSSNISDGNNIENQTTTRALNDNLYFDSYSYIEIHEDMLKDEIRTEGYRQAIFAPNAVRDKIVLDVGCGTGILSFFAVQAGAAHVFAIDQSNIIYEAMDIAKENGMSSKITFIKGKIEDTVIPVDKVDVIISEWMGYFLMSESMIESIIWARDHLLRQDGKGLLIPSFLTLHMSPLFDPCNWNDKLTYWNDVYGLKMSALRRIKRREIDLFNYSKLFTEGKLKLSYNSDKSLKQNNLNNGEILKAETLKNGESNGEKCEEQTTLILAKPEIIKKIDMYTIKNDELELRKQSFSFDLSTLNATQNITITSLMFYFDVQFFPDTFMDGSYKKYAFSTGPFTPATHWKQTALHFPKMYKIPLLDNKKIQNIISSELTEPKDTNGIENLDNKTNDKNLFLFEGKISLLQLPQNERNWSFTLQFPDINETYHYDLS